MFQKFKKLVILFPEFPLLREAGDFYGQLKYFIMWYLAANQEVFHIIMQDNHWA
mgnify:CR=1 FL=1